MNKIKCSNGCVYSRTMNQIYPRLCVNCGGRELVSLDQKWRSPTGASIANHETDHIPDGGRMVSKTMNDLKTVRDALESAKTFLGQTVYVRGYGEQQYSEVCVALSILDRMIETPAPTECQHEIIDIRNDVIQSGYMCKKCNILFSAGDHNAPTEKVDLDVLKKELPELMMATYHENKGWNACIDHLANTGRLR